MRWTLLALGAALVAWPAAGAPAETCRLLTAAEISSVQAGRLVETKPTAREAGGYAIGDCFYRMEPFTNSVSLEVTRRAPGAEGNDPAERWERMFRPALEVGNAEREGSEKNEEQDSAGQEIRGIEREKAPPEPVAGVGDEAFWIGNRASGVLYAFHRGRRAYVRVSVGGAGTDEEKRAKAAELARRALRRL